MVRNLLVLVWVVFLGVGAAFASCSAPQNTIEAENCNPGSPPSQWSISGSGDSTIQGFATDISVNAGQTVHFKINTTATNYRIDIYRLGYYQGNGARLIASFQPSATLPQIQPACLSDSTTKLVDCGDWAVSASWTVPPGATSGIYFALLTRADTGGDSQIQFIVRNDSSHSDILFQTSDETWHAYNPYGGHSLYGNTTWNLTDRAYKVSYNRPFNTANLETATWVFSAEYPMVRWLEANGYDVTYFTSVDAARSGSLITNHRIYLSVGHDEYWSGPKRTSVEAARAAGVNLAFFSGNEGFWKTRWENSIDGSNVPYRTLVCYKETLGPNSTPTATTAVDPLDPPTWTGTWRDPTKSPPADGGRPENSLNGTIFRVNGPGTDNTNLAIQVPAADGKMRFWRNTAIGAQSAGQTWTLPAGTLGYEWDVDEDNGFRPAGLFDLSTSTRVLTSDYLLDYGGIYGAGTAVHHLTMYRFYNNFGQTNQTPLGLVFGAGTVQWSWGLDANHDNSIGTAADVNMQQATVNLFADMGVQPATLQSGLLPGTESTDTVAPTSQITFPTNGTQVRVGTTVNITGISADSGSGVVGGLELSLDGGKTWHPAVGRESWVYAWTPTVPGNYTIQTRATDDSGNLEIPSAGISVAATTNAQTLTSLTLNAGSAPGGSTVQGTVMLGQPATTGGIAVTLTSTNPSVASVPSSVTVPAGQFSANFTVTTFGALFPTSVTISGTYVSTSSATLTVTSALPPPPGNVAIDAFIAKDQATAATTVTSGTFSTSVRNELILALVATDALSPNITVTSMTGGGLSWTLVRRTNTQMGTAEIWRAFAANPVTNASATANLSQNVVSSMLVMSFAGVDTSGTNGSGAIGATVSANASTGTPTASLTTTRNNSMVLGVGNDWDQAIARVVGPNQTMLHQDLSTSGDTYWTQILSAPIPMSGTVVTINDTAPTADRYNLSAVEVLPATGPTYAISGSINPVSLGTGATVTLSQGTNTIATVTADASGNFTFSSVQNGAYTATPSKSLVSFTPASQTVTVNGGNVTGITFTATSQSWNISGTITPPTAGITVNLTGTSSASTTTNGSGNYSFGSLGNGTYTVTPAPSGYTFSPISQTVTVSGANITGVNFTATQTWSISGTITPATAGITVTLTGTSGGSTTTDASGNYSFAGLANGTYTVTPTKAGYTFGPGAQPVTVNGANVPGVNFTAQSVASWSISGTISPTAGGAGATVILSGAASATTTTDANGNYSFTGLANGSYTVSPSETGYTFTPTNQAVTLNGASQGGVNFTAQGTASWSISGTIGSGCSGCAYVQSTRSSESGHNDWPTLLNVKAGDALVYIGEFTNWTPGATVNMTDSHGNTWYRCDNNLTSDFVEIQDGTGNGMSCQYTLNIAAWPTITAQPVASQCVNTSCTQVGGSFFEVALPATATARAWATPFAGTSTSGTNNVNCGSITLPEANDFLMCDFNNASGTPTAGTTPVAFTMRETVVTAIETGLYSGSGTINPRGTINTSGIPYTSITVAFGAAGNGAGATVTLSGTSSATTTANANGNYSFTGLTNGSYVVTPSEAGLTFAPTSKSVTVNGANQTGVNFTVQSVASYGISGTISGGAGAAVALSGPVSASTVADGNGNYAFTGLASGTYTVTPTKAGYTFSPAAQTVTVNGANVPGVNFTATVHTWTISGTITPATAGITVNLTGTSSGSTTTDASGSYTFGSLANGTYTLTPSHSGYVFTPTSLTVTVNSTNVSGQNFTWATAPAGIVIDANLSKDNGATSTTIATPAFSTTAGNELLLAFIATDYLTGSNTKVNSIAGGGLTWTLVRRTNTQSGTAEIWWAFATAPLSNTTVTATLSQKVGASITLLSYTGVDTTSGGSGAVGATGSGNARTGAPTATLATTRNNSWVFGVGNDFDNAIARTPSTGQTLVHQFLTPSGDTYWVQMQNSSTPSSGTSVTLNDTAPSSDRYNLTTVEVRTP